MESEIDFNYTATAKVFNTPLEIGLRCLVIMKIHGAAINTERLMFIDYLSLNTADIAGPQSIHAPLPNRGVQVYARKNIVQKGIVLLLSKELITIDPSNQGFNYLINDTGRKFLEYFATNYYKTLVDRIGWTVKKFADYTDSGLETYITDNLYKWGSEFLFESGSGR
jgi:hypothetical protein